MSAIVTTVLKGTLGFLIKKGRKAAVERLKDSDVTNEKLKNWIVDEIDSINSKLDAMAKKDLGASISFFKEGLVFLNNAMETITCGLGSLNASPVQVGKVKNVKEENFEESNEKQILKHQNRRRPGPGCFGRLLLKQLASGTRVERMRKGWKLLLK